MSVLIAKCKSANISGELELLVCFRMLYKGLTYIAVGGGPNISVRLPMCKAPVDKTINQAMREFASLLR